jgi:hypothetical protein
VLITVFLLLPIGWCWLRRHRASRRRTNAVLAKLGYIHRSASPRGAAPYDGVSALASNKRYIHMESELEPLSPVPNTSSNQHQHDAFACGNSVAADVMEQSVREQRKVQEDLEQQQRAPVQGGRQYGQHWKNNSSTSYNGSSARRSSGVLARNAPHLMSRDMSTIASSAAGSGATSSSSSGTTTAANTAVSSSSRHGMPVAQPVVVVHTAVTSSSSNGNNRNGQHHRRHQHQASTSTNSVHSFNSVDLSDSSGSAVAVPLHSQQQHRHGDIPVAQAVLAPTAADTMSAAQRAVMLRQSARGARTSLTHASAHNSARLLDINGAPIDYNPWQRDSNSNSVISTTSSIGGARDSGQGWERVWLSQSGNSSNSGHSNSMQR